MAPAGVSQAKTRVMMMTLRSRHGLCVDIYRWWRHRNGTLHVQTATGYTLTDAELFCVLDDSNPCFDGTNECWNDVIPRIRSFHYGQLVF